MSTKYLLKIVHSRFIRNSQKSGNSKMPISRRRDKQCYIYTLDTILQERPYIHIDESQKYYGNKSRWTQKKCIVYDPNYMKF